MSNQTHVLGHQQTVFTEDGELNDLEANDQSVETTLEDHGVAIDHRNRKTRIDRPVPDEFGVDDRPEIAGADPGEQETLFVDVDEDQSTLDGDPAAYRPLFDQDQTDS